MLRSEGGQSLPGGRLATKEIGKLRRGDMQGFRYRPQVTAGWRQVVKRLSHDRRVVVMGGRDGKPALADPRQPAG